MQARALQEHGTPGELQPPSTGFPIRQQLHLDIAARGFRVRADRVRLGDERFGLLLVNAGELRIERRVDEETTLLLVQGTVAVTLLSAIFSGIFARLAAARTIAATPGTTTSCLPSRRWPVFLLEKPRRRVPPGNNPFYDLSFSMRSFLAYFLILVALWQVAGGGKVDLATATLAIAAAWFLSLFVGE